VNGTKGVALKGQDMGEEQLNSVSIWQSWKHLRGRLTYIELVVHISSDIYGSHIGGSVYVFFFRLISDSE
jgi:hypothetical protein